MKINKILNFSKRVKSDGAEYAIVTVQMEDGTEASVVVGGNAEVYLYRNQIRAHIKRNKAIEKTG